MARAYQKRLRKRETKDLRKFFARHTELFLPFLELIERSSSAITDVLESVNYAVVEALLELSATKVAGPVHQGRPGGPIRRHGHQGGVVALRDRKLRVNRPRLRRRRGGEVEIPAYEALHHDAAFQARVEELMMKGVSTRDYASVIEELAETAGVSKSSVSREFIEASARSLEELSARRWEGTELLLIYLDGVRYGEHHVIAVGSGNSAK
jgi:transposase-like protein